MIPIFDLDDTLYDEQQFVRSGFRAVARWGKAQFGWDTDASYKKMLKLLSRDGRGRIFNQWLDGRGSVREALRTYRHHTPDIALWPSAKVALDALKDRPLYLVTDGHKIVQANKIAALKIGPRFRHAYITHRYGLAHAKPSTHCFELIKKRERCRWEEMIYVGDNPDKDFINLNTLGVRTVRVMTGQHAGKTAQRGFDARYQIRDLSQLLALIDRW
jgi:putative hydrolase of the HAD superfamily